MKADTLARATEQAKFGLFEFADNLKDLSDAVTDRCKYTYRDAERGARKLRIAAEAGVDDTRKRIKSHPLAAVVAAASGGFVLGWLATRRGR